MTTVLLIDYPVPVRRALRARLSLEADLEIVGEADDAAQGLCLTRTLDPAVVLLDAETPDLDTPALVRSLLDADRARCVVVLSQHSTSLKQVLAGTSAVVVGKHEGLPRLVDAIRSAGARARRSGETAQQHRPSAV
jgi:DNA-binding NarL/FixJ family response regulator